MTASRAAMVAATSATGASASAENRICATAARAPRKIVFFSQELGRRTEWGGCVRDEGVARVQKRLQKKGDAR